jgi:ABC-type transport system involved in Fe-S cluster assembly fused permease/ATPase subunit
MSMLSFNHLLNLSFSFHTHRKTGEVLRILDRGAAINHTFELLLFNIIPTFVDIFVALVFFVVYFEWTLAVVIFFVFAAYGELVAYPIVVSYIVLTLLFHSRCKHHPHSMAHSASKADERP